MADTTPPNAPNQPSSSGHRRGRPGRPRGRVNHPRGPPRGRGGSAHVQPSEAPVNNPPAEQGPTAGQTGPSSRARRGGRPRGQQGRGTRGERGGRAGHPTQIAPQRSFGGRLTSTNPQDSQSLSADAPEFVPGQPLEQATLPSSTNPKGHKAHSSAGGVAKSHASDLTTRLHQDISSGQHECIICSGEVTRKSRIWACKLCWTVTHYQCTKKWFNSSAKVAAHAQDGADPDDAGVKWRCPGCNSEMIEEPESYHCWCGKEPNPRSVPGLPPHSCGQTCSKPRGKCPHPCFLQCHAGPCPPCHLMAPEQVCHCGKNTSQKPCTDPAAEEGFSCDEICDDLLPCGEHFCRKKCHPGVCGECDIKVPSYCYCGKEKRDLPCGLRDVKESYNIGHLQDGNDESVASPGSWFDGSFTCWAPCKRKFDCDAHECQKNCHPLDEKEAHCPFSPDVVTHCPCGKTPLEEISPEPRQSCSDDVPHCDKPCGKSLACGHQCLGLCHTGDCSPCFQRTEITCRCGRNTMETSCHGVPAADIPHPECRRLCKALKNCGRHQCDSHCCAGEKRAIKRQANKRKTGVDEDVEDEHICTRTCGRLLKCGKHFCQQLCHKGPCPGCLEAVFSEITCSCGRTTLYPPQPCGTTMPQCRFNCTRARTCGHPQVEHQCHPDDVDCPKCPFLVRKPCHCGKELLANQPCWFDKPRCGKPCGKRLKCGTHVCKQICHRGPCEDAAVPGQRCSQTCGKLREACGHEDQDPCHALLDCKDDKPCQADKWLTCECQRRKQKAKCLSTRSEPKGPPGREGPKCDDECLRQKRNRQLAEALNLDPDAHTDGHIPYQDATLSFFRDHTEWATKQEGRVREFAESPARYLRFEPMKPAQRLFLHMLAQDFGVESGSEDPEPHRFVTLHKGASFVAAPHKMLLQAFRQWKKAQKTSANSSRPVSPPPPTTTNAAPYNALLLTRARFGLTGKEVDAALSSELGAASAGANNNNNSLTFTTSFLPSSEEVLIRATAKTTIASIASGAVGPAQVESLLVALKPKIAKAVAAKNLAAGVILCHTSFDNNDDDIVITRREGTGNGSSSSSSGWNTVASRAAARPRTWGAAASSPAAVVDNNSHKSNGFVALRKLGTLTKKKMPLPPQSQSQSQPSKAPVSTTTEATSASVEPTAATTSTMATTDGGGGGGGGGNGDDSVAEAATTTAHAAAVAGEEEEKEEEEKE